MKDKLEVICDTEDWTELDPIKQLQMELRAMKEPSFFWNSPEMGNNPLWPQQARVLDEFFSIDPVTNKRIYNELLYDAGRQGGKTFTASLILCTELYRLLMLPNPHKHYGLSLAKPITLFMSAAGFKQTMETIFPNVRGLIENSPYLSQWQEITRVTSGMIKFPKKINIEAVGSNLKTSVGRTVKAYVAEEVNSVGTDTGMLTPAQLYNKLSKSTTMFIPFGEDTRVAISSKTSGYDFLSQAIQNRKENKIKGVLSLQKDVLEMNPTLTKEHLERERLRDEDSYNMEYGLGPALGGNRFFKPIILDRIKFVNRNIFTIPKPKTSGEFIPDFLPDQFQYDKYATSYLLTLDPSTVNDPFGISVMHYNLEDKVIIDGSSLFRSNKKQEINPTMVKALINRVLDVIPINYCIFDIYMYNELRQEIDGRGIELVKHILNLADWNQFKDQCSAGLVECPDEDYIKNELQELIIKGNKVDHPNSGTKDVIDTIANGATFKFRDEELAVRPMSYIGGKACVYR